MAHIFQGQDVCCYALVSVGHIFRLFPIVMSIYMHCHLCENHFTGTNIDGPLEKDMLLIMLISRMSDLPCAVVGSNPGHGIAGFF